MKIECANPEAVAKRAFFLAYQASQAMGMGHLRSRDGVTEDAVWDNARTRGDYPTTGDPKPNTAYGDYVFGRMMKLGIKWDATSVTVSDSEPRSDYQSWCGKYPTYYHLISAAMIETGKAVVS